MEVKKEVEVAQVEITAPKKPYQQPKLVEHGQWTDATLPGTPTTTV